MTCSSACSKKLTAKRDAAWRARNPDYEEHRRLLAALERADEATLEIEPAASPLAQVPWRVLQVALGGKKLDDSATDPKHLIAVHGVGYKLSL